MKISTVTNTGSYIQTERKMKEMILDDIRTIHKDACYGIMSSI